MSSTISAEGLVPGVVEWCPRLNGLGALRPLRTDLAQSNISDSHEGKLVFHMLRNPDF